MSAIKISTQVSAFVAYKQQQQHFFTQFVTANQTKSIMTSEQDVSQYVKQLETRLSHENGRHFIDDNLGLVTQEFTQLANIFEENAADSALIVTKVQTLDAQLKLKKQRKKRDEDAEQKQALEIQALNEMLLKQNEALEKDRLMYLHYAILLMAHAHYYYGENSDQVKAYQGKIKQLIKVTPKSAFSWYNQVVDDLSGLAATPLHTSKIRGWIGFANIYRIHLVMDRLTWKQTIRLGRELKWLDQFDNMLGIHVNAGILDSIAGVSNVLSVGLFASRFMLNTGLILKHTLSEKSTKKATERFWRELKKRHWVMVNDVVWATVNALTNYSAYFHISDPAAGWILAAFLLFDTLWLGWRLYLDEQAYATKKTQYEYEISTSTSDEEKHRLREQLRHLGNQRYAANAGTLFNMSAAFLLTVGFSATMLFASPILVPLVSFFVCTVAVGMYLSADKFAAYVKESRLFEQDKTRKAGTLSVVSGPQAKQAAWNNFIFAWAKNTLMPLLLVGVYTVSLPAAIILTLLYIGYECSHGYMKQEEQLKLAPLKLVAPSDPKLPKKEMDKSMLDENVELTAKLMKV